MSLQRQQEMYEETHPLLLTQRIQDTLFPWQASTKRLVIGKLNAERLQFYSIWHSREYLYNRSNAQALRISNTYLYPAIRQTFASTRGTEEHRQALIDSLTHFRYKARKTLDQTLHDFLTAYKFLAIPLHLMGCHWAVALVVNLNRVAAGDWVPSQQPTSIFLLDSLSGSAAAAALMRAGRDIRRWLRDILQVLWGCVRSNDAFQIIHIDETAQQPNGSDCGLYVHHHLRTFLAVSNPERIILHYQNSGGTQMRLIVGLM
ncbi:hypothetical protein FRC00_000742 [Tulasnella sp. 408]|nr:hypothetical protein FRC00_000742 [Tulasnella sp. 408]